MKRRGSALLIVLGMLSFMVVSAVSFAMFMRQSRAPSSYLRRSSTSRYLLKAALANAIARLDGQFASERQIWGRDDDSATSGYCEGVYDDPYPGVGPVVQGPRDDDNTGRNYNGDLWVKRVFCPFGSISPSETVSTLTLEALAYLPPAIINEVRVYSRRTRTARWRNLAYDAGRYAFTAVDVSDCFDVNKLLAGERRTSAPNQRVNLSSLFPQNGAALDTVLTKWDSSEIPFVSVADFNVMAENSPFAPFYRYVNTSGAAIYQKSDAQSVSNALFITDTWFPPTNRVNGIKWTRYDISLDASASEKTIGKMTLRTGQPFKTYVDDAGILDALPKASDKSLGSMLVNHIGAFGMMCLYDYLDEDHTPLSLCMPCTEAVPMVCGLGLAHGGNIKPQAGQVATLNGTYDSGVPDPVNGGTKQYNRKATKYAMTSFGGKFQIAGTCMLPFRRLEDKKYPTSFTAEALVKAWWALVPCGSRLPATTPIKIASDTDWNDSVKEGIITIKQNIPSLGLTVKDEPGTEEAMGDFNALIEFPNVQMPLFWYVEETDDQGNAIPNGKYYSLDGVGGNADALIARGTNGEVDEWWANIVNKGVGPDPTTLLNGGKWSGPLTHKAPSLNNQRYVMHIAVWIKIMNGDEVVDIVPARLEDDNIWNQKQVSSLPSGEFDTLIGDKVPILEFRCSECPFTYDVSVLTALDGNKAETFQNSWDSIFCADPRFNWAPENWFVAKNGTGDMSKRIWIDKFGADGSTSGIFSLNDRDHDIFMFASDQEELQSIGELQFLPFVGWVNGSAGGSISQAFANELSNGGYDGASMGNRTKWDQCACANMFWKSYSPFDDPLYEPEPNVEVVSSSGDFRVNPFSPDARVLMAAVKDTPYDYFIASPSETLNKFQKVNEVRMRSFNEEGSLAKLGDDAVQEIVSEMQSRFTAHARSGRADWISVFDNLPWFDGTKAGEQQKYFMNVQLEDDERLYGVDRKYLYSFWRECFQNRQQLFLVFLRAEPLTVGGMGQGSLASAQLGARGVALVWRDPAPPARPGATRPSRGSLTSANSYYNSDNFAPHRTRVLFYHQFD